MWEKKLPGDYVAGFVDGEGCFYINFRRDVRHDRKNKPIYFYWDIAFAIVRRADDKYILEKIKNTLNCGNITINKLGSARFQVTNTNDLVNKIVPFFKKYELRAKKKGDYILWKKALEIFKRNQRKTLNIKRGGSGFHKIDWHPEDLKQLKEIQQEMRIYKSKRKNWKWL